MVSRDSEFKYIYYQTRWQVSKEYGHKPHWSPDGRKVFYLGSRQMMSVSIEMVPIVRVGIPRPLFILDSYVRDFDVSNEDGRFLMIKGGRDRSNAIVAVLNWLGELERLAPHPD